MNELLSDIWPYLLTALVGGIGTYVTAVHNLKTKVTVLEQAQDGLREEVRRVEKRLDKKSEQFDMIQKDISNIRESIAHISEAINMFKTAHGV